MFNCGTLNHPLFKDSAALIVVFDSAVLIYRWIENVNKELR